MTVGPLNIDDVPHPPNRPHMGDGLQAGVFADTPHDIVAALLCAQGTAALLSVQDDSASSGAPTISKSPDGQIDDDDDVCMARNADLAIQATSNGARIREAPALLAKLNETLEAISRSIEKDELLPAANWINGLLTDLYNSRHELFPSIDTSINTCTVSDSVQLELANFRLRLLRAIYQLLKRQASLLDACQGGFSFAVLCQDFGLEGFYGPPYPHMENHEWDFLQLLLDEISPMVRDSEYLPAPLQVLYTLGAFAEMESELEWLRRMGKTLTALSDDYWTLTEASVLPKFLKLDVLFESPTQFGEIDTFIKRCFRRLY